MRVAVRGLRHRWSKRRGVLVCTRCGLAVPDRGREASAPGTGRSCWGSRRMSVEEFFRGR